MKILFIGDIVGRAGRQAISGLLPKIIASSNLDIIIANGENAAGGFGITPKIARELFHSGIDVLTSGNHIWKKREIIEFVKMEKKLLRPANYPPGVPGNVSIVISTCRGEKVGILNLLGRVFMGEADCPFSVALKEVQKMKRETKVIIVDIHAEATSEKVALGRFLDGKVSAVIGTHTHVPTADARILPEGTAYITDVGMTGAIDSVIGIKKEAVIEKFLTQMPQKFETARNDIQLQGIIIEIDPQTGKSTDLVPLKMELGI